MSLTNGIHSLTREQYDAITDRENFSVLKLMHRSPAHFHWAKTHRDVADTDARQRGRIVAMAVFEPDKLRGSVAVFEGARRAGKEWEAFKDRNPDKEWLTTDAYTNAVAIAAAVRADPQVAPFLRAGKGEQTLLWTYNAPAAGDLPGYEMQCKARIDFITEDGWLLDLKNARDGEPRAFGRHVVNYLAHAQAAMYLDAAECIFKRPFRYGLIAIEPAAPFVAQVYEVPPKVLAVGRALYRGWLDRLNVHRRDNTWPGYAAHPMTLELPHYAMPDDALEEEAA